MSRPCRRTSATKASPRSAPCCWCGRTPTRICPSATSGASCRRIRWSSEVLQPCPLAGGGGGRGAEACLQAIQNRLFIDGEFVDAEARARIPVLNPHDNSLITEVAEAQKADIDRAVDAARRAFPAWAKLAAAERGRLLLKLADAIEARASDLAELETLDTGHPLRDTKGLALARTAST